jgi:hypothetical protein
MDYKNNYKDKMSVKAYCETKNLYHNDFTNMQSRFFYKQFSNPDIHEKYVKASIEYWNSNESLLDFCRKRALHSTYVTDAGTHLKYKEILERLISERGNAVNFVEIENNKNNEMISTEQHAEPEFIEKKEPLRLSGLKGIEVLISNDAEDAAIIKIINFMRTI